MGAIGKYLDFLWNSFQYDITVFSHGWLYYWLLIPAIGYAAFFVLKWVFLTVPLWMPFAILVRLFNPPVPNCRNCAYRTILDTEPGLEEGEYVPENDDEPKVQAVTEPDNDTDSKSST